MKLKDLPIQSTSEILLQEFTQYLKVTGYSIAKSSPSAVREMLWWMEKNNVKLDDPLETKNRFTHPTSGEKILGELCYQINESNLWNFIKRWCWYDEDDRGAWQSRARYFGEIDNGLPKGEGRFYEGDWPFPIDSYRDCLKDE